MLGLRALAISAALLGCSPAPAAGRATASGQARLRIVLKHQPLWGDPAPLRDLLARFSAAHPDLEVVTELLPNAPEMLHQHLLTSFESRSRDFDVVVADVIWVAELARAGWVADLSPWFPAATVRRDFLPGVADAVIVGERTFAVPWYVDVGLLYYRTDLVPRAPKTVAELEDFARAAQRADRSLYGYVWQGRQYEGLVCVGYEAGWAFGARTLDGERALVDSPEMAAGLGWLRSLVASGLSPRSVTSAGEEEARRVFQDGRAVFMRNWPYAFQEAQREGSRVAGRVGFAPLPTPGGEPGTGALGGWQLVVNASAPAERQRAAAELVAHLTSAEANVTMALAYGRNPPRVAAYADPRLRDRAPFIAALEPLVRAARPRPVTPYYVMISDVLQSEFSAIVSGIRTPARALAQAQQLIDHVTAAGSR
jgi:multiple sugar transport system substrate-binding protein